MNTQTDNYSITGSPLMCLEFMITHTLIWGFLLCALFYFLDLFVLMPLHDYLGSFLFYILLSYFMRMLFSWPGVMLTALNITIVRCFLRRTRVTLSGNDIIIRRMTRTSVLSLDNFVRPKTVESFVGYNFIGLVFRRRYLIFRDAAGKEVKYRLYEYSKKDLERVMQLISSPAGPTGLQPPSYGPQ